MTQTTTDNANKAYSRSPIDECILDEHEQKPLYAASYDESGVVRISNTPVTLMYAENDFPRGEVPFEAFLTTPAERYRLMDVLFQAEWETRWSGDVPRQYRSVAPIDEQSEMKRFDSPYEHSIIFNRTDGEQVSMVVGKGDHPEVSFTVETEICEGDGTTREQMTLSYAEARVLRDLLNSANLDQD